MAKEITIFAEDLQLADGSNGITVVATSLNLDPSEQSNSVNYIANNLKYILSADGKSYVVDGVAVEGLQRITIPNLHNGKPVTDINAKAFYQNENLTNVTIEANIRKIGSEAFAGCINLTTLNIKDRDLVIYFKDSGEYSDSIYAVIPVEGNTYINKNLVGCDSNGDNIYRLIVPSTAVGLEFFKNGTAAGVKAEIDDFVCFGCYEAYTDSTGTVKIRSCDPNCLDVRSDIASYSLSIESNAFQYCDSLASITIPNSVYELNNSAFRNMTELTTVSFSATSGIRVIGMYSFWSCNKLTGITLPNSLEKIESSAFASCSSMTEVVAGTKLKEIGSLAFNGCSELTRFFINGTGTLEKIQNFAFSGCTKLSSFGEGGSKLPNTVWYIGNGAFSGCDGNLKSLNFAGASTAAASGWFYTSGSVSNDRTTDGLYNALSAELILDKSRVATALTNTYKAYTWFKIKQMPAPTIELEGLNLKITDKTGIADTFMVYSDGVHWATINLRNNNSITLV